MTDQPLFSIIDYTYAGGQWTQAEVAERFSKIQRDWVAMYPGFKGARFLGSTDQSVVRAIVEWDNEASLRAFESKSDTPGRMAALQKAFDEIGASGARQTFRLLLDLAPVPARSVFEA